MGRKRGSRAADVFLSPSRIAEWATCRRRYELRYIEKWELATESPKLVLGSAVHAGLAALLCETATEEAVIATVTETIRASRLDGEEKTDVIAQACAILRSWELREGWEPKEVEQKIEVAVPRMQHVWLRGIVDMVAESNEQLLIVDHKVSSRQQNAEYAAIDIQLLAYYAMMRKLKKNVVGAVWSLIVVPGTKRHQGETGTEYENRLVELLFDKPGQYFQWFPVVYSTEQVTELWALCRVVARELRTGGNIYRNPKACQYIGCAYRPICLNSRHAAAMGFIQGGANESGTADEKDRG